MCRTIIIDWNLEGDLPYRPERYVLSSFELKKTKRVSVFIYMYVGV